MWLLCSARHELSERIEQYTKKHPEIIVTRVDDNYFAGSDLVLIPHNDDKTKEYFGTTVVYVPQCTGEDPIRFFLYPWHARGLLRALGQLQKTYRGAVAKSE